jgi:hypothetical protein
MRDIASPLDGFASPFGVFRFNMQRLFAGDTAGIYHNFSDLTSLYTDSAGATPLTLPDTTIGLVADRSRVRSPVTVAAGIQASAGLRPKWGRAPKVRRNLLTYTEQFDNAAWTLVGSTVSTNSIAAPDGATTADTVTTSGSDQVFQVATVSAGSTQTFSCYVKRGSYDWTRFTILNSANEIRGWFNVASGTAGTQSVAGIGVAGGISISDAGNGWYRCSITGSISGATAYTCIMTSASADASFTRVSGTRHVWGAQLELGSTATAYQKTASAFDMTEAGLPSYGFTRPDRSDDVLATTIPTDQTGDVAIFGRNGSWIENAKTYAAASTFSLGATTATGLASGVLAAVGDIVGVLAIGKALSDAEKQLALDYHAARGAAGWLTAGAEMLTNGDFASDTVWTKGTGWTIAAGVATKVAGVASVLAQAVAPTSLVAYQLDFTVTRTAGTVTPRFTGGTTVSGAAVSASGTYRQLLVAASGNTAVDFSADTTFAGTIDNVSLKPLVAA